MKFISYSLVEMARDVGWRKERLCAVLKNVESGQVSLSSGLSDAAV